MSTNNFQLGERQQTVKYTNYDTSSIYNNNNYLNTNISINSISNKNDDQAYYLSSQIDELKQTEDKLERLKLKYQLIEKELSYTQEAYNNQNNDKKVDLYKTQLQELKLDLDSLNFSLYEK